MDRGAGCAGVYDDVHTKASVVLLFKFLIIISHEKLDHQECCKEVVKIGCSKCVHAGGLLYLCQYIDCVDKDATCTPGTWFNSENEKNCNECFCLDGTASFCYPYLCYGQKKKSHELVRLHGVVKDKSLETCTPGHEFIQGVPSRCEGCKCKDNGRWACWHEYRSCNAKDCEVGKLWIDVNSCSVCYCLSSGQKMCGTGFSCTKNKQNQSSCTNRKCTADCYNKDNRTLGLCLEEDCICTPPYTKK
ncbi:hypothetical protein RR46_03197 [Papilio xuthus]|uniref:Pacifastin domain-containing protein n=1 Tax=Papilio xuthus TaxID=66420 RepID=A0A194Q8X3_PAPXU|nr:hypothetical protein RR46_03197 [Papilio xuthus]